MRFLRRHWKKLVVLLLFAGSFAAAVAWAESRPRLVLRSPYYFRSVSFSEDGKTLVTASLFQDARADKPPDLWRKEWRAKGLLQLWDLRDGRETAQFEAEFFDLWQVPKLSPDGSLLAFREPEKLRLIDVNSKRQIADLTAGTEFDFSPDGKTLAYLVGDPWCIFARLVLWDTRTRRERAEIEWVCAFAFSPDAKKLATVNYRSDDGDRTFSTEVPIWDSNTATRLATYPGPDTEPAYLGFSDDGQRLVWVLHMRGWSSRGRGPDFHEQATIKCLNVTTGAVCFERREVVSLGAIPSWGGPVTAYRAAPVQTRSVDDIRLCDLMLLDIHSGQEWGPFRTSGIDEGFVAQTWPTLSPDRRTVLVGNYADVETNPTWLRLLRPLGLSVSQEGPGSVFEIHSFDAETRRKQAVVRQEAEGSSDNICFSPDGKTVAVWWDGVGQAVYLWDIPPKKPWLRILAWSAAPMAGLLLLVGLYKLWRQRNQLHSAPT